MEQPSYTQLLFNLPLQLISIAWKIWKCIMIVLHTFSQGLWIGKQRQKELTHPCAHTRTTEGSKSIKKEKGNKI